MFTTIVLNLILDILTVETVNSFGAIRLEYLLIVVLSVKLRDAVNHPECRSNKQYV